MSIELTDTLRIVRPQAKVRPSHPQLTLKVCKNGACLFINRAGIRALGLTVDKAVAVHVLVSRSQIAIKLAPGEPNTRTLQGRGMVLAHELGDLFGLKEGDVFAMPATVQGTMIVANLPDVLYTRQAYLARKNGRAA